MPYLFFRMSFPSPFEYSAYGDKENLNAESPMQRQSYPLSNHYRNDEYSSYQYSQEPSSMGSGYNPDQYNAGAFDERNRGDEFMTSGSCWIACGQSSEQTRSRNREYQSIEADQSAQQNNVFFGNQYSYPNGRPSANYDNGEIDDQFGRSKTAHDNDHFAIDPEMEGLFPNEIIEEQYQTVRHRVSGHDQTQTATHMIDMNDPVIDPSRYPPEYWARLREYWRQYFELNRSQTQDVSYPAQRTPPEVRCFGVTVKVGTKNVAISPMILPTCDAACEPLMESDANIDQWITNNCPHYSPADRKVIRKVIKSMSRTREEFVEIVMRFIKPPSRETSVSAKPVGVKVSTSTDSLDNVPSTRGSGRVTSNSQLVDARPQMESQHTETLPRELVHIGCETETPIRRSRGTQAESEISRVTSCGIQTEDPPAMVHAALDPFNAVHPLSALPHQTPPLPIEVTEDYEEVTVNCSIQLPHTVHGNTHDIVPEKPAITRSSVSIYMMVFLFHFPLLFRLT